MRGFLALALATGIGLAAEVALAEETGTPLGPVAAVGAPFDLAEAQGVLEMLRLDGWLLYDYRGLNPLALEVVRPTRPLARRWFVLIPARGEPMALVHRADASALETFPGRKIEYTGWRDLDAKLRELTRGRRRLAAEYSPKGELPEASRVDAGTVERLRALQVELVSSAELVQAARARWGKEGRASHYTAVHHLIAIRDEVLAYLGRELGAGRTCTERDVVARIERAYAIRGLEAEARPVVASGPNSADLDHAAPATAARPIRVGDLVLLGLAAREAGRPDAVYAELTWMAYAGSEVPRRYADVFAVVAKARDAAVELVGARARAGRPVRGFEVDKAARDVVVKAGLGDDFVQRTGHSLGVHHLGDGANLDDLETHDTRSLIAGAGFSIEPGIAIGGEFGVRTGVSAFLGVSGLELTTPLQRRITPLLVAPPAPAPPPAAGETPVDPY